MQDKSRYFKQSQNQISMLTLLRRKDANYSLISSFIIRQKRAFVNVFLRKSEEIRVSRGQLAEFSLFREISTVLNDLPVFPLAAEKAPEEEDGPADPVAVHGQPHTHEPHVHPFSEDVA